MLLQKGTEGITFDKIAVLILWFAVLVGIRVFLGFILHDIWIGTLGAVAITFAIFYASLRYTKLQKYRYTVNLALKYWYKKKFFFVSGIISLIVLGSIIVLIDYGRANFSNRLIQVNFTHDEIEESFGALAAKKMQATMLDNLERYSPIEIMAITLASADQSLDGYYSKIISFMFAEDIEIMVFIILFRTRMDIFATNVYNH